MDAKGFQSHLEQNIALTKLMNFELVSLSETEARGAAPLSKNDNHRGSAFGGSLYNTLVLTSYSWLYGGLLKGDSSLALLIQNGEVEYLTEVLEEFEAVCKAPSDQAVKTFLKGLESKGKARIDLESMIFVKSSQQPLAKLRSRFVALKSGD
jgi:thioesterase domain-containing protein